MFYISQEVLQKEQEKLILIISEIRDIKFDYLKHFW